MVTHTQTDSPAKTRMHEEELLHERRGTHTKETPGKDGEEAKKKYGEVVPARVGTSQLQAFTP